MYVAPSASLNEARRVLVDRHAEFAPLHEAVPALEWRTLPGDMAGLVRIVVGQQVSIASADTIWARVEAGLGQVDVGTVTTAGLERLRSLGLSLPKARHALAIAEAVRRGDLDFCTLNEMSDETARAHLMAVKGVGPWTADIYLMFALQRRDIFPAQDIALQETVRWLRKYDERPDAKATADLATGWSPLRSAAAHLLWGWYKRVKAQQIAHPHPT